MNPGGKENKIEKAHPRLIKKVKVFHASETEILH